MITKTIDNITYYADPTDLDLWYDNPNNVGNDALALATFEIDSLRDEQRRLRSDMRDAERGEGTDEDIPTMQRRIAGLDDEIRVLRALSR